MGRVSIVADNVDAAFDVIGVAEDVGVDGVVGVRGDTADRGSD